MPYAKLLLAAAAVVLACFALVALFKSRRGEGPMLTQGRGLPPMKGSPDASERARRRVTLGMGEEILGLLESGRRAEAVALVRETSGWDEAEAERMIAKLEGLKKRLES
jgi:hypothetical protein